MKYSPVIHAQWQAILPLQKTLVCIMLKQGLAVQSISSVHLGTRPDQFIVVDSLAFHWGLSPKIEREGLCEAPGAMGGQDGLSAQDSSLQT